MVFDHLPWFTLTSTRVLVVQQDVIMIVLELATGGELFDFMMYTGSFPESTCGVAHAMTCTRQAHPVTYPLSNRPRVLPAIDCRHAPLPRKGHLPPRPEAGEPVAVRRF